LPITHEDNPSFLRTPHVRTRFGVRRFIAAFFEREQLKAAFHRRTPRNEPQRVNSGQPPGRLASYRPETRLDQRLFRNGLN
jgi:hypothetical protein